MTKLCVENLGFTFLAHPVFYKLEMCAVILTCY